MQPLRDLAHRQRGFPPQAHHQRQLQWMAFRLLVQGILRPSQALQLLRDGPPGFGCDPFVPQPAPMALAQPRLYPFQTLRPKRPARIIHSLRAVPGSRGCVAQVSNLPYRRLPVGGL